MLHILHLHSMKKLLFASAILLCSVLSLSAQSPRDSLPYMKNPSFPAFEMQLADSATVFNTYYVKKGKPIVVIFFSPECDHCQHMTEDMLAHMKELKKATILMVTPQPLEQLREFNKKYELDKYKNITTGKELHFFFFGFYSPGSFPFIAVYDKDKQLVTSWNGGVKIEELIKTVNAAR